MERKISNDFLKWKNDVTKKPMFLYGISGCGKSYSAINFGKTEYKNTVYFDCFDNLELSYVFDKNSTSDKLIRALSAISLETIFKEDSLIIFDNVTLNVMETIKKLFLADSFYHIIMISNDYSLLKVANGSFNIKKMTLVSFPEYLTFKKKEQLISFIEDSFKNNKPIPFHSMAMELYNDYVLTGGYPNAIVSFDKNNDFNLLSTIHNKNISMLLTKLFNIDNLIDIKRSNDIYKNVAIQLLKENKKFMYGLVKTGARAKEYDLAIKFMIDNGILIKSTCITDTLSPITKYKDDDSFKLYYNDSGILYNRLNVSSNRLLTNDKLMLVIYENNIISVINQMGYGIYYYHSTGKAFIDLVIQTRNGKVIPIEIINSGASAKSKSMALTISKYNLNFAIRFTNENFSIHKEIKYVPYYAAFMLENI